MLIPPPQGLLRGKAARSSRVTGTPARASVRAAVAPAGPPPTTRTDGTFGGEQEAITSKYGWDCEQTSKKGPLLAPARRSPGCVPGPPVAQCYEFTRI